MTSIELKHHVENYFRSQAERFHLNAGSVRAERVLNWGGFVSPSFRIGDGQRSVHVKLATDHSAMRRCLALRDRLESDYRAPKVLAWVDITPTPYQGLVFEHIDGQTWDTTARPALVHDLSHLLSRLHHDSGLAAQLGNGARSYRHCWELRYREQFEEDLRTVAACRPRSVTDARLSWMQEEARKVLALPAGSDAFEGATQSPCHWDLWPNNVLVEADGRWWVLDWDGLAVGDEAEDFATLVWPFVHSQGKDWRELLGGERDRSFAARMDMHLRAIGLDYLIDVLADWGECDVPEWTAVVQRQKELEHEQYLDWYLSRWG